MILQALRPRCIHYRCIHHLVFQSVAAAQKGDIEFELLSQGTLAEALQAGGTGIGGFYTPTAHGTVIAKSNEIKEIDGTSYVFQKGIRGNVAFVRAWRGDTAGNLVYHMTEQNFNKAMATAAELVITEDEQIIPIGTFDPDPYARKFC
ncbi:MAG: 3-oxoacid CoA-transferase subunit B [Chloroflexi bacterium AL-W]|nr:3-oxoacid CoA-transferase subunit B [Chloroflexi bacterium AL-N1]NOK66518.1 3-oxoacid CoA-transferase subunit B [Chloroflexi bacterium AL-N10]NOK71906.1 3-oxoacid CoA-transferase subunit B [Chloroflexi bacterium AL-N5]NOK81163.1 3-oxoacid CoA-transferase subunit B [Chloroflexi bacterium AL-W]NOK89436.1 3-oxoacid CoA-transferase subunit B [Chloroflexi bacterium AL-N15]